MKAASRVLSAVVAMLVLNAAALVKVASHHQRPNFAAGGAFVANGGKGPGSGPAKGAGAGTDPASGQLGAQGAVDVPPTTPTTTGRVPTLPVTSLHGTKTIPAPATSGGSTTSTSIPSIASAGTTPAAYGTYIYAMNGSEGATGFGDRPFPSRMTISVHGGAPDPQTEDVYDVNFSSSHSEREIVQWGADGVSWTFEAGSVQFPLFPAQKNQGFYSPPMLQIPAQLTPGLVATGSSDARLNGSLERVEDWTISVVGTQTLAFAGQALPTVMVHVHRQTRPGASQDTTRDTTFWYSPTYHTWVRFQESLTGSQMVLGLTFSYHSNFTATLVGYSPG